MYKWDIQYKIPNKKNKKLEAEEIINVLLTNRGLKTKNEIKNFLNPELSELTPKNAGISTKQLEKSIRRIEEAISKKEQIIIFGDYDVDGICGTAILWEVLNAIGVSVLPYIPHRIDEGYGLSEVSLKNILEKYPKTSLIITVDNGIVANKAVDFANKKGIDVIITDHHVPAKKLPSSFSIVHTTLLCGAGVAFLLARQLITNNKKLITKGFDHLSLAAIATIADLVPATGLNRIILKHGLEELRKTERPGFLALIKEAQIEQRDIGVYEIGHVIGPRINAMGRLEFAMDSLRLLCTKDQRSCETLAKKLNTTNQKRKDLTIELSEHARNKILNLGGELPKLLFISDETYQPGVIGLMASRLVEEFYRPSIVLSIGEKYSKASARSIAGFNIIEFIRESSDLLVDAGGHPMAAGFTVETSKIKILSKKLLDLSHKKISQSLLVKALRIDVEISFDNINDDFFDQILKLAPFGVKNPQPVFVTRELKISDIRFVGSEGQHVFMRLLSPENKQMDAIAFNFAEHANDLHTGDKIDVVYAVEKEIWQGNTKFKLKLKDLRKQN